MLLKLFRMLATFFLQRLWDDAQAAWPDFAHISNDRGLFVFCFLFALTFFFVAILFVFYLYSMFFFWICMSIGRPYRTPYFFTPQKIETLRVPKSKQIAPVEPRKTFIVCSSFPAGPPEFCRRAQPTRPGEGIWGKASGGGRLGWFQDS